jgi:two-component system nitrate/nitrite response regulator NarL
LTNNRNNFVVKLRHLFLSAPGDLLPRWQEAFPKASAAGLNGQGGTAGAADVVWLRLVADSPAPSQIAEARKKFGAAAIVVMSDIPTDEEALSCFSAAARGYCNSHASPEILNQIANVVSQGGVWIGPGLMQRLLDATHPVLPPANEDWAKVLTERERQVARTIAEGASNKEIARQLGITERTVKAHTGAIFEKLKVRDRLQLVLAMGKQPKP